MSIFIAIVNLLPTIIQLIKALEEVMPESGQGTAKLGIVTGVLSAVSETAKDEKLTGGMPSDKWLAFVASVVSKIVSVFNATGVFKKA